MKCETCIHNCGTFCNALTNKTREDCSFAKTKTQLDEGRQKAAKRIADLPLDTQTHIKQKYYQRY